jgi:hypothetical protein
MHGYDYGFLPFVQLFVSSSAVLLASVRRLACPGRTFGQGADQDVSHCCVCGYSTEGLSTAGVCPECGASAVDRTIPRRLVVDPERLGRWRQVLLANLITWVTVRPAAYLAMMLAYRRDGIDWGRASRWVGLRELADDSRISAFGLMYPLLVVTTVVLPPCVLLPARWWRGSVRLLIGVWFAALAFSMWRIAAFF